MKASTMNLSKVILTVGVMGAAAQASAGVTQIGSFQLDGAVIDAINVNSFNYPSTRAVIGAPVAVDSSFMGLSQNPDNVADTTDLSIKSFGAATQIVTLNRFGPDPDGPGGAGGPQRAGAVQWNFDLSPIDGYLAANSLTLTALDLGMVIDISDNSKGYDLYLSYTNAGDAITKTDISMVNSGDKDTGGSPDNYNNFWLAAQGSPEGTVVGGTHKVLKLDASDLALSDSLLSLYNDGVRDVNLIMMSGDFLSTRQIKVLDGSGLSITTEAVPEPGSLALLGAGGLLLARRRRR